MASLASDAIFLFCKIALLLNILRFYPSFCPEKVSICPKMLIKQKKRIKAIIFIANVIVNP